MDDGREVKEAEMTKHADAGGDRTEEARPYLYRDAGIREQDGTIPLWLKLVVVGLLGWSLYYIIQYWSPD